MRLYKNLPEEILLIISGYYPSPELTIVGKCNISQAVYKYKINKIKIEQRNKLKERTLRTINRLYNN